jgi:hypothetical protein
MPFKLNISPRGRPCGKKRWHDRAAAEGHRQALESWERIHGRPASGMGPLNVYRCEACGAWHVGHKTA